MVPDPFSEASTIASRCGYHISLTELSVRLRRFDEAVLLRRSSFDRGGLTLLEMLLSAVILATALSVLAQQTSTATRAALRSQLETEAALRCQSQLNRLLVEKQLPGNSPERPFEDDPRWYWSSTTSPSDYEGFSLVTVDVFQSGAHRNIASFSLSRLSHHSGQSSASVTSADRR